MKCAANKFIGALGLAACASLAQATTVTFYNSAGDALAVDFLASSGQLKPGGGAEGFYPFGQTFTATYNGRSVIPLLNRENEPGSSIIFFPSVLLQQAWIVSPGQIASFSLTASGPFFEGNMSLDQYQGLASGNASYIGSIYSINKFPVPVPATLALLGLGLVGLRAARRKQA